MSLFYGIPDDVYDCHLFPLLGTTMRLNRSLDAHYKANATRVEHICDTAALHPLLVMTPYTDNAAMLRICPRTIRHDQNDALILYAVHVSDFKMLKAIATRKWNLNYDTYHVAIMSSLAQHGNGPITQWLIYQYFDHTNTILESKISIREVRYNTIKLSDFAKLVLRFLNSRYVRAKCKYDVQYQRMIERYIYNLIDVNDKYIKTIIAGLRGSYCSIIKNIFRYTLRKAQYHITKTILSTGFYYDTDVEYIIYLIRKCYYKPLRVFSRYSLFVISSIAFLMGASTFLRHLMSTYGDDILEHNIDDINLPLLERLRLLSEHHYNHQYWNQNIFIALHFDNPSLFDDFRYVHISHDYIKFINMNSRVAKSLYTSGKVSLLFRLAYERYHGIVSDSALVEHPSRIVHSINERCSDYVAILKYASEDKFVEKYGTGPNDDFIYLSDYRRIAAKFIIKRGFSRLYATVDSTCWILSYIYAHKYGNLSAREYFGEKIKRYHDKPNLLLFNSNSIHNTYPLVY